MGAVWPSPVAWSVNRRLAGAPGAVQAVGHL